MAITINSIPDYALKVARILLNEGFDCYLVGGAVRDLLLNPNLNIEDLNIDFATNATPEMLIKLDSFPKSVQINEKFGTLGVIVKNRFNENKLVDVTTYRSETDYIDGRWPSKVKFGVSLSEDLSRRDFTINALALDMKVLIQEQRVEIIDEHNGLNDLNNKIIKAVGDPLARFSEDGLRALRGIRFASTLQFEIEQETLKAISKCNDITAKVSIERVQVEFAKMILKSPKPSYGIRLMNQTGLLKLFIPELVDCIGVTQLLFHNNDVYDHSLAVLDASPDEIKLAGLFHDIGKPRCDTKDGHFYGHDQVGAEMTEIILKRLRFPNSDIDKVCHLIREHMFYFPSDNNWSDGAVRRFINRVGLDNIEDLFKLRIADAEGNEGGIWDSSEITRLQARISNVLAIDSAMKVTDLAINGNDLIALGVSGKDIGITLKRLLDLVLDDPSLNNKTQLISIVQNKN